VVVTADGGRTAVAVRAYSNCHSGVSQLEDGRTAVAVRCRNACCSLLEACSGYVHNALKKDKLTFQKLFYINRNAKNMHKLYTCVQYQAVFSSKNLPE